MKAILKSGRNSYNAMSEAELEKKRKELMESPIFKQAQQTVRDVTERMQKVTETLKPTLERVAQVREQIIALQPNLLSDTLVIPTDNINHLILKELRILNAKKPVSKQSVGTEIVISYDMQENTLMRTVDGTEYIYHFKNDAKRKKLFDTLRLKKSYLQRKELKVLLGSPTADAVSTMVKTLNEKVAQKLHLNKLKIIVAKSGSGYRINANVIIQRV
ncbi:MAG: hypothetical protein KBB54_01330 [Candidatus Pacebacteria bacterium]|nr:hypothetical protein [Candidatus Paceibacterota bacterium]MBP9700772.1 hypothetical protein [Candidatus Paceibacterota bacterium]